MATYNIVSVYTCQDDTGDCFLAKQAPAQSQLYTIIQTYDPLGAPQVAYYSILACLENNKEYSSNTVSLYCESLSSDSSISSLTLYHCVSMNVE